MLAFAMPVLTRAQVEAVAALAHLELEPGEVEMFARQLGDILTYADELQHLDTTGVPPTAYGVASRGADRPDEVRPSLAADEVFGNAPERDRATGPRRPEAASSKCPASLVSTLSDIRDAIRSGERSAVDVCRESLDRIAAADGSLHAFNTVMTDEALARAAEIDRDRGRFRDAPLAGVPVALKDNICTKGVRTTASSKILEGFVPPYDATVVSRLEPRRRGDYRQDQLRRVRDGFVHRELGVRPDEQSLGARPHSRRVERRVGRRGRRGTHTPGTWLGHGRLDSTAGGACAACSVSRPTYGRVSRYGLLAFASSLDQIGPLTRRARDAAIALETIAGLDAADSTTAAEPVADYQSALSGDVRGARIGVPWSLIEQGVDAEIVAAFRTALDTFTARGATLVDIEMPHAKYAIPVYYLVATAEASSNLARYDGVRYGLRDTPG